MSAPKKKPPPRLRPFLVFDTETDPFLYRHRPEVFLAGLCDGKATYQWWGDECIESMVAWLEKLNEPHYIYAHNGGKFDFFYLPWPLGNPHKIINGRIVEARLGKHILRDSFAILPFPLSAYKKTEIDYDKFKRDNREKNRDEIMSYHRDDLRDTFTLVDSFRERFGNRLTIASTAMRELQEMHPVPRKGQSHDEKFRPYYFGGRVQCFETGDLRGHWKAYDVNSMYPSVMKNALHPIGSEYDFTTDIKTILDSEAPGFAIIHCHSNKALPTIANDGRLVFPDAVGRFHATTHEIRAAVDLGLLEIHECEAAYLSRNSDSFGAFVTRFAAEKSAAKKSGDKVSELFAKLMLNSAYGKFGANPENYYDWKFITSEELWNPFEWELFEDWGWLLILRKPAARREFSYFDVATAASITGAARACLLGAIAKSRRAIYCDTDSIICESLDCEIDETKLGAWKLEAEGNRAIILGKKLYCLIKDGKVIKSANKGVQMALQDFITVSQNKEYTYFRDTPTFKKDGNVTFIQRTIKGI